MGQKSKRNKTKVKGAKKGRFLIGRYKASYQLREKSKQGTRDLKVHQVYESKIHVAF